MYGYKEKSIHYNQLLATEHAQADYDLLKKVDPTNIAVKFGQKNPLRQYGQILFALLDLVTREQIIENRREYAKKSEDAPAEDTDPEGSAPEDTTPVDAPAEDAAPEGSTPEKSAPESKQPEVKPAPKKKAATSSAKKKPVSQSKKKASTPKSNGASSSTQTSK